jgi:hypothetical protein
MLARGRGHAVAPQAAKPVHLTHHAAMRQEGARGTPERIAHGLMYATGPPNGFFSRRIRLAPVHLLGFNLNKMA